MGYLVDTQTEQRLGAQLGRMPWFIGAFFMLQGVVRLLVGHACHVRIPDIVGLLVGFVAFLLFHYTSLCVILRGSSRAAYRPTSDELLRLRIAKGGRTGMVFACWSLIIVFGAFAVMFAIMFDGLERWLAVPAYAAFVVYLAVNLRRIEKIPD